MRKTDGAGAAPDPQAATVEDLAIARERAIEARRWIRATTPLLAELLSERGATPASEEVRAAVDTTIVAVLARVRRLVRSDMGPAG